MAQRQLAWPSLFLAAALMAAACGSGGNDAVARTGESSPAPPEEVPEEVVPTPTTGALADESPTSPPTRPTFSADSDAVPCPDFAEDPRDDALRLSADLDGDGQNETVLVDRPTGSNTIVTVCGSSTVAPAPWDVGDANKPANVQIVDVDQDGTAELLVGAPTAGGPMAGFIARLIDGTLEPQPVDVAVRPPVDSEAPGESFGCAVDSDGLGIVTIAYELVGGSSLRQADALVWSDSAGRNGEFTLPAELVDAWLLVSGTCGDHVTTPVVFPSPLTPFRERPINVDAFAALGEPAQLVSLWLGDEFVVDRTFAELSDPAAWVLDRETYNQFVGPFSALDTLQFATDSDMALGVSVGPHRGCPGPPIDGPANTGLTQLSIQPLSPRACGAWFAINLFVEPDFTVRSIALELGDP